MEAVKTLILGMGNPILSDDGIGIAVARALDGKIPGAQVEVSAMIGLELLDIMEGYDRIVVIDAMCTRGGRPGEVRKIAPEGGAGTMHLFSSHGVHFFELMELGRNCGLDMPEVAAVYGIEIGECVCFDETLSPGLQAKVTTITDTILAEIMIFA